MTIFIALLGGLGLTAFYVTQVRAAPTDPVSLWTNQTTPSVTDSGDPGSLELGLKFQSSLTGSVTGVKFYKGTANLGTHIGNLWDSHGNNLASVTFSNETASGWQTAAFAAPVHILANTTYVISYFAPQGNFSIDSGYFGSSAYVSGPLTGLKNGTDGANGVYAYNGSSVYPSNPSSSDNYWVDVIFTPDAITPPVNVKATQYQNSVTVVWSAGTNSSAVTQYDVSRNGVQIGVVSGNTTFQYIDTTGLQPGTTYNYSVTAVDTAAVSTAPSNTASLTYVTEHTSVRAIDSANTINDPAWFTQAYSEGFRLYIMDSTAWGTCTPWNNTQAQLGMALDAGFKVAAYTPDPSCWQNGILATGPYQDKLQFFALNVESDIGVPVTRAMINGVKSMNVRPVIYTGSGMWSGIQGATANDFSDVSLWDTNTSVFDYAAWQANYLAPAPVPFSGWNTSATMRIGVQQEFEYTLNGINVDLNSFDASFLTVGDPVIAPPDTSTSSSQSDPTSASSAKALPVIAAQPDSLPVADTTSDTTDTEPAPSSSVEPATSAASNVSTGDIVQGKNMSFVPFAIGAGVLVVGGIVTAFIRFRRHL